MPVEILRKGLPPTIFDADTRKKRPELSPRPQRKAAQWDIMFQQYMHRNLASPTGKTYSIAQLAKDFGIPYKTVANRAYVDNWPSRLKAEANKQDELVRQKLAERRAEVASRAIQTTPGGEIQVRQKQAALARLAQNKAAARLKDLDPKDLSIREAIELLRLGLVEERRALGMPDLYQVVPDDGYKQYMTTERARGILSKVIEMARSRDGKYEKAVSHG